MTGTAAELTPLRSIDRITVGAGRRGPITKRLQDGIFRHRPRREARSPQLAHARGRSHGRRRSLISHRRIFDAALKT